MKRALIALFSLVFSQLLWATGISFTFANASITGSSPKYYEFDVMAQADAAGTKIGDNIIYINYNTLGFGTSVVSSGKVEVSKGVLLEGGSEPFVYYTIINTADNTDSRFAVTCGYNYPDYPEYGNDLPITPTKLLHIKMEIADANQTAGLSFEPSLMAGQEYESDNSTKYDPVIGIDTDDSSLPVQLTDFTANLFNGIVQLEWSTESEIDNLGFEILRSEHAEGNYISLASYSNNSNLKGHGSSSSKMIYSFKDNTIRMAGTYWYKLIDVDYAGNKTSHPAVSVTVSATDLEKMNINLPTKYKLYQNFPNPFNPSTQVVFDIPQSKDGSRTIQIAIYNNLGKLVRTLFKGGAEPGRVQLSWDGKSDSGVQLPTGIYFTRLTTQNFSQTIKMTLLK